MIKPVSKIKAILIFIADSNFVSKAKWKLLIVYIQNTSIKPFYI